MVHSTNAVVLQDASAAALADCKPADEPTRDLSGHLFPGSVTLPTRAEDDPKSTILDLTRLHLTHYPELKDFFDEHASAVARVCELSFIDLTLRDKPTYFTIVTECVSLLGSHGTVQIDLLVMYQH